MLIVSRINNYLRQLDKNFRAYPIIGSAMIFFLTSLLYASIYIKNPGTLFTDDHFFLFKYAYVIRMQGWDAVRHFKWIAIEPGNSIAYQLTLFNLALIPFTYIKDMTIGLKVSDIFWASLSVSTIYYTFRKFKFSWPSLWILALASVGVFAERVLIGRALVLVPAFLMLELYFAKEKKYFKFFLISLLHIVWHPSTFFFPMVIALLIEVARMLANSKFFGKNIIGATLAFFIGINLTLYSIVGLLWQVVTIQLLATQKANDNGLKIGGTELYPVDLFKMTTGSQMMLLLLLSCFSITICYYVAVKRNKIPLNESEKEDNVLLYSAFLFALMSFAGSILVSGRFYDYYFVSVIFLAAAVITVLLKRRDLLVAPKIMRYFLAGVALFFLVAVTNVFLNVKHDISNSNYDVLGEVASWVALRSNKDDRIFLSDWSLFPVAFFYNSKNIYNIGIEPEGLRMANPELYWKWYNIFVYRMYCDKAYDCLAENKKMSADIGAASEEQKKQMTKENSRKIIESIKNDFDSRFLVISGALGNVIDMNPDMIADKIEKSASIDGEDIRGYELK